MEENQNPVTQNTKQQFNPPPTQARGVPKGLQIVFLIFVVVALLAGGYIFYAQNKTPELVACTADTKLCPDGNAVGRTGPNCEFAECPENGNQESSNKPKTEIVLKPDYSEETRAIKETEEEITINFEQCSEGRRRVDVELGSTTIEIKGKTSDGKCQMDYGGEVENPNWDGSLPNKCLVPTSLKTVVFKKTMYGLDLTLINDHCTFIR